MNMNTPPSIKLSARKTHRKTRTGCRTCKQRKIKCDEQRPSCHNCIKHSVQCDFLLSQSAGSSLSNTNTPSNHASPHVGTHTPYSHDQLMVGGVDDPQLPGLNLLDLELLHNYITTTSFTLHTDPAMKILWKINVPQVGFQYDFVMRGVLAISALHMARYKPERKDYYIAHAMQQHQLGLRMATSAMHDLTKENCTGVWLFSALTLFFTLGSPRGPNDFLLVGENGLSDWLFLVKGTSWIIDANEEQLKSGHLGPMFLAGRRRSAIRRESLAKQMLKDNPLDELQGRIRDCGIDGKQVTLCANAVDALRVSFVFIFTPGPVGYETSDILYWVFSLSDEFLQLMKEQTQESMAILAFFCVVLRRLDSQWWLEGWSTHLMAKIWQLLDEEHRLWIRWPIEEIGWIPPFNAY